jgi:cell fate regulator YaaT (PSP1 superfamily)
MHNIYGVVLKDEGKIYYFDGQDMDIEIGNYVVVNTEKGIQYGKVLQKVKPSQVKIPSSEMKEIIRIATEKDYDTYLSNLAEADKAMKKARELVDELELNMNILDVSYTLDKKQLLFNFVADERVDFRELAKRLAAIYKTRIELRQVGARDKAKEISGIGPCGRKICCSSFLSDLDSVGIAQVKNQNLALNPTKINGLCGRLLCCLKYEDNLYSEYRKNLPEVGDKIKVEGKDSTVISIDIPQQKYVVLTDEDNNKIEVVVKKEEKEKDFKERKRFNGKRKNNK